MSVRTGRGSMCRSTLGPCQIHSSRLGVVRPTTAEDLATLRDAIYVTWYVCRFHDVTMCIPRTIAQAFTSSFRHFNSNLLVLYVSICQIYLRGGPGKESPLRILTFVS
jgi:hypothetical protein